MVLFSLCFFIVGCKSKEKCFEEAADDMVKLVIKEQQLRTSNKTGGSNDYDWQKYREELEKIDTRLIQNFYNKDSKTFFQIVDRFSAHIYSVAKKPSYVQKNSFLISGVEELENNIIEAYKKIYPQKVNEKPLK